MVAELLTAAQRSSEASSKVKSDAVIVLSETVLIAAQTAAL